MSKSLAKEKINLHKDMYTNNNSILQVSISQLE